MRSDFLHEHAGLQEKLELGENYDIVHRATPVGKCRHCGAKVDKECRNPARCQRCLGCLCEQCEADCSADSPD